MENQQKIKSFWEVLKWVFLSPTTTLKYIHDIKYNKYLLILIINFFFSFFLYRSTLINNGKKVDFIAIILFALIIALIFGLLSLKLNHIYLSNSPIYYDENPALKKFIEFFDILNYLEF